MKKLIIGLTLAAVCGVGVTTWASTNSSEVNNNKKSVLVTPVENTSNITGTTNAKSEVENYIESKYGSNWANDLYAKNGDNWDDILEDELEVKFGETYDDLIDDIIDAKEATSGLDKDDIDDLDDVNDDLNDHDDVNDDINDLDDNDADDMYDLD